MPEAFDIDLFSRHDQPLATYMEPAGYSRLAQIMRPQARHYAEFVPVTCTVAESLFDSIEQKGEWGAQYVTKETNGNYGAAWRTENTAHQYLARAGKTRRGKELTVRDVLRSLTRADVYAIGRTDRHIPDLELGQYGNGDWRTTPVSVVCLDVDMDKAWSGKNIAPIRRELTIESNLAAAIGLTYRVFRTGGRGHQAVLPLPIAIDRSAATWLLDAYLSLLAPYHRQAEGEAKADAHNLQGIVRIVGGRHARTERVALWVDPVTATLYPVERQMEMMQFGYRSPNRDATIAAVFADAAAELTRFLFRFLSIHPHECANPVLRTLGLWGAVEHLPDNPLVGIFRDAQEQWALGDEESDQGAEGVDNGDRNKKHKRTSVAIPRSEQGLVADEGTRAWADRVWTVDWPVHDVFWGWVNEGGQRGITAAKVLFGDEGDTALQAMLDHVDAHPITREDPVKARNRKRVLRSLYRTHVMLPFRNRTGGTDLSGEAFDQARALSVRILSADGAALIPEIIDRLRAAKRVQARCVTDIERIVEIILLALETYAEQHVAQGDDEQPRRDYVELSLNDFVVAVRERWPDDLSLDRSTVRRHLQRLTADDRECGYALIAEVNQSKDGVMAATRYRAGADLRATVFGSTLPPCILRRETPIASRALPLMIRVSGGVHQLPTSAKRGRKRVGRPAEKVADEK